MKKTPAESQNHVWKAAKGALKTSACKFWFKKKGLESKTSIATGSESTSHAQRLSRALKTSDTRKNTDLESRTKRATDSKSPEVVWIVENTATAVTTWSGRQDGTSKVRVHLHQEDVQNYCTGLRTLSLTLGLSQDTTASTVKARVWRAGRNAQQTPMPPSRIEVARIVEKNQRRQWEHGVERRAELQRPTTLSPINCARFSRKPP